MASRKRRGVNRVNGSIAVPPTSTYAVNTRGFAALPDEMHLEIVSHIPSVPIPTSTHLESYPEIRRSRRETFLSLSQTSRSLRRFFLRYLWQRIEVREGMKIEDRRNIWKGTRTRTRSAYLACSTYAPGQIEYTIELVRQLEIVTIRNPQLAQYVNYLDIFLGPYSMFETVLAELARCLSLFLNLHTVQINVQNSSSGRRSAGEIFEQTFKKYSYPQIRNVFVMQYSGSFIASCPQARRVGSSLHSTLPGSCLQTLAGNCPHPNLEVLEGFDEGHWTPGVCKSVVEYLPNLRTIQFTIYPLAEGKNSSNILKMLNLQTIIMRIPMADVRHTPHGQSARTEKVKEEWIKTAKRILIQIQLRDNLEKTIALRDDYDGNERRILIKPKSSFDF